MHLFDFLRRKGVSFDGKLVFVEENVLFWGGNTFPSKEIPFSFEINHFFFESKTFPSKKKVISFEGNVFFFGKRYISFEEN